MTKASQHVNRVDDMLVFARVVEAGGLAKAAKALGTTRSAVSKTVARLEERLGAHLLHRTTREFGVTAVGRAFYDHCSRIAAEVDAAERVTEQARGAPAGLLRVACSSSVATWVAAALPAFLIRYPRVALELALSEQMVDLVREGIDVGIRLGQMPDSSLVGKKLAAYRRVIVASPTYLASHGNPTLPADLVRHNCLVRIGHTRWKLGRGADSVVVEVTGNYRADSTEMLRHAVCAGLGLAMLPSYVIAADLVTGELVEVLPTLTTDRLAIYAVYPHQRHVPSHVRAFVAFLAEALGHLSHSS
jgi:DNA-binding transcriptional LysR family regulator